MRGKGGKRVPRMSATQQQDFIKSRSNVPHVSNVEADFQHSYRMDRVRDPEKAVPEQEIVVFLQNVCHVLNPCEKPCTHIQCGYAKKIAALNGRILMHGVKL